MKNNKFASAILAITTLVSMGGASLANAATTTDLQAQIATLLAQINTLQAQLGTTSGSTTTTTTANSFTSDLTVGSTGAQVLALQKFLVAQGDLVIATPTSYFGAMTQKALAKFQAANNISPAAGYFGAKTRAFVNSMGTGTTTTTTTTTGTTTTPTGAPLSITLNAQTPGAQNLAAGAVNTPVLKLNFTAGATPVTITNLILTRSGLSQDSDLNNVYIYDGATKLASNLGFNNGAITFSNGAGLFTVPANTTKVITVSVDVDKNAGSGHILVIGLNSAANVTGGTFTGTFPINSNQFSFATVTNLATITLSGNSSSTITANAGQTNVLVGQFNVQAGNNPVKMNSITLTNIGNAQSNAAQNIKLMNGSTQLGATISSLGSGNTLTFDLSGAPLMLTSGQSAVLSIYADVTGGVGRQFQFSVQQSSDVLAIDTTYGVGIGANAPDSSSKVFPVSFYNVSIQNGGLVISKDAATPTTYAVAGNTNQVLAKFDVLASGDSVKFNELDFSIAGSQAINNFRVVDDQGAQLGTTKNIGTSTTYQAGSGSLNYIIPANTTRVLTVYGDLPSGATGSVGVTLGGGGSSAQSYTTFSTVGISTVGGNTLTVLGSGTNLLANTNYGLGSPVQAPAGASAVKIGSYTFTAGQINSVNLTGITITTASNVAATNLRNLKVLSGTTQIGSTQPTVAAATAYPFNSGAPITIAANAAVTLDVYADISSSLTSTSTVPSLTSLTSVNASTLSGNAVSLTATVTGQDVAFSNGGSLSAGISAGTSQASFLGMNVPGVNVAQYQFKADGNGNETLTQLKFTDSSSSISVVTSTAHSDFVNYRLTDTSGNVLSTASEAADGSLSFNLTGLNISVNSTVYVNLVADTNSYPYAKSGNNHAFALTSYQYTNASQSVTTSTTSNFISNVFTIYQTTLGVTGSSFSNPSSIGAAGSTVGQFSFTAGSGSINPIVKTVTLYTAGTLLASGTVQQLGLYDSAAPSVLLASSTLSSTTPATFYLGQFNVNQWALPYSSTKTLLVKTITAPTGAFASFTSGNTGTYQVLLNGVQWSDGTSDTGASVAATSSASVYTSWIQKLSPSISIPVASQNITGVSN